ncbi:MAG: DUF4331 domain-containing protein [Hydrogenophaga sp.]|uniref:DUF4331 domain-containing protein n=1 Tax=Hydrogenophaga sp. TaxID=1904254 RepID=UPI001DF1C362|nr:DUF4331 domain-containing protein [Hydrogenophaga sp.]MBW0171014.1 DUF4331 domain-containing protein [Hydrogenophaga sp.]MBW0185005.1 DUF4331 domain-containing protein [Hydrogenophaga sp.]
MKMKPASIARGCLLMAVAGAALASSHREAPFIATVPKVDGTDFYMFRSYEGVNAAGTGGRSEYVTMIANYQPLQGPYGGPNYFSMDPNALYEIHIDNNGDAREDITFQFRFNNRLNSAALPIGTQNVQIPLIQAGPVSAINDPNLNLNETYSLTVVRGDRRRGVAQTVATSLPKPVDYIGQKTLGDAAAYKAYADRHINTVNIPGCAMPAKVFVGQRQEGFAVNLGRIFDLVNAPAALLLNPAAIDAEGANGNHYIQRQNVTSLALEVHRSCLTTGGDPVIGGWTTASLRQARLLNGAPPSGHQASERAGGAWTQVSRLGNPLVNEVVIGLGDKDKFNASAPRDDGQFLSYVTNPTLPALLGLVLAGNATALAPTNLPRTDLATTFLTGITGVNKPVNTTPSEMLRLNTAVPPVPFANQNRLGVAGNALNTDPNKVNDNAGFPNGRRPKDDVVDIALVAMVGGLCVINGDNNALGLNSVPGVPSLNSACRASSVPLGATSANIHDAVDQAVVPFQDAFPYLNTPNPGASNL